MSNVAIIGAGPAGAAAACLLSRCGHHVTLIESRVFPRPKVCGEFVSPAATPMLEEILPASRLLALGARRAKAFVLELDDRELVTPISSPAWALSRATLDEALVGEARSRGTQVLQPASVRSVRCNDGGVVITLASGDVVHADIVVHADGHGRHDGTPVGQIRGVIGLKCHLRTDRSIEGVRIRSTPGAYVGTIQVERGMATCALVARASLCRRFNGDHDALLQHLWPRFDPSWREGAWLASGVARSTYISPSHLRSFRIGNAAAAVDPIGGEGIGLALWSAWMLARTLPDGTWVDRNLQAAQIEMAGAYRRRLRARLPTCRFAAWALMRPTVIRGMWPALAGAPSLLAFLLELSGKRLPVATVETPASELR